jgi:hypothetical protein
MSAKTLLVSCLLVGCVVSCSSNPEEKERSCVVESGVGVAYCLNDMGRTECAEHGESLDHTTISYAKQSDCREQGFTQPCEAPNVFVAQGDDCSEIGENWARGGAGGSDS